jgi:cystathionine beta-lyase/cystathionine gamma-synthase
LGDRFGRFGAYETVRQFGGCRKPHGAGIILGMKKTRSPQFRPQTRAIHAGEPSRHGVNVPVTSPIVRSSTFSLSSANELKAWAEGRSKVFMYTRDGNPTLSIAEKKLAALEGGEDAVVTAAGMAATSTTLFSFIQKGDEIISTAQVYGGSYRLMRDFFPRFGVTTRQVESSLEGIESLVTPRTKILFVETPTNPTLYLVDLRRAAAFAKKHGLISIVDNTFATPMLQNPIEYGFDLVIHSVTKGLAGHSDILGGVVVGSSRYISVIRKTLSAFGGIMDPEVAFLLMRGIKTLGVRIERQCETAMRLAKFLEKHPKISRVHYPGLKSHPDHALAKRQMRGFGSMLAFDLKGGLRAAHRFADRVRLFVLAASLGGVESLIILPIYGSHQHMSKEELARAGVEPGTVRVSVGLEDPEDLIEDLQHALR